MKILVIGSDRNLFKDDSAVLSRIRSQGELVSELHIVVFSKKGFEKKTLGNIFIYPTDSRSRWGYIADAERIGKKIIGGGEGWIVSAQDPFEAGLCAARIVKNTRAKLHIQIHTDFLSPYFARHSLLNRLRVHIARRVLRKAQGIRVVSERVASSLQAAFRGLCAVPVVLPVFADIEKIKNGVPVFDLHRKYPQFEKIILMASRLEPEKDIACAIRAMASVVKKYPKTGLVIVGSGSEEQSLKFKVESAKLESSIIFEGWQNDLVPYYKTADIFLNTSRYEGYGVSLVEAAAAGLPIVTTDVGIAGEIIGKDPAAGAISPVGDHSRIADALGAFLGNPSLIRANKEYGGLSFATEEEYWGKYKKMWESLF